jgi:hypothetical protein
MDYFFFEYLSTEMIPGDWEWYLETYVMDPNSKGRAWIAGDQLVAQAYEIPSELDHQALTAVAFVPANAKTYSGKSLPAPPGVRWGILTCLRKDFADLIGEALVQNASVGRLHLRSGKAVHEWVPILVKHKISIPVGKPDNAAATAKHLGAEALYASDRYSLILREDIYQVVRGFRFDGCKITRASASPR